VIDFNAAETYLRNLSTNLSGYTVNGTTTFQWGGLTLTGSNPYINVFSVDGDDLSQANNFEVNAPNGSVVVVNISGSDVSWTGGATVNGTSKENVIYNFYQAHNITIQGIAVLGTILAPKATVDFVSGVQYGQMICKNLTGQGQFNLAPFIGNIPVDPKITNSAEITSMSNPDTDLSNNIASVTINVDLGSGNNGGGNGNNPQWELVNQVGSELIWTMAYDNNGRALYGTWGGKLYREENGQNTVINTGMNVGFIWSVAVDPVNDKIWVATENGVYISRDDGATWELRGLSGKDVRSIIAVDEDHVWAGTWGSGVYELSASTGYAFVERNDGLTFTAVHALAVNSAGDIYAGTFGGGVMKLEGGNGTWGSTNMPYDFVWALAIDGNDKIYAGTYGGGVYVSEDDGGTWTSNNDGLANQYIYSITVNPNDEVFASAWAAGVYKLNDSKDGMWSELGMNGVRVTSVSSGFDGYVYAATEDGRVYRYMDKPLGAEEESETVTKFDLAQNYPNPFNPTTQISFSVAKAGNYELAVYNMLGQKVATLVNGNISEGEYNVRFDAGDLASGIYIYRLQGEGVSLTKKMMLMK
jgi:ligand-binding sensor domain-containing protein